MDSTHEARLARAWTSLEGLSVGDAFGGFYELGHPTKAPAHLKTRTLHSPPWHWTDDTNMALSIYSVLRQHQQIEQYKLAHNFALHFDRGRGYGMGARHLMVQMKAGMDWRTVSPQIFKGGSYGNGGAMRVAPVGAYFADDWQKAVEQARLSSEITHSHPEGIAGAIAVTLAAAHAAQLHGQPAPTRPAFIDSLLSYIPESDVKVGIVRARDLPQGIGVSEAVEALGNGSLVSAQDTIPFTLWCAGEQLANYEESIWLTANGFGDVDTTCAIVGGIVACYTGTEEIPPEWVKRREPLPAWAFEE